MRVGFLHEQSIHVLPLIAAQRNAAKGPDGLMKLTAENRRLVLPVVLAILFLALQMASDFPGITATTGHAEVIERLDYDYYEAVAKPHQSLLASVNEASPIRHNGRTYHGYTKWNVHWRFFWHEDGLGRCRITSTKTTLTATIQLPELKGGTASQRKTFEDYSAALMRHEWGHYEIGREAAASIDRELLLLPAMEDCPRLERRANELADRILEEHRKKERAYDTSTGYGKSQGAWLRN
jgi:predicted secreted Zn-dependent protease